MLVRNCSGGVVFLQDKVLLLFNEKSEWVFPKGVIRSGDTADRVAVRRVEVESGVEAKIIAPAGKTNYEFYSISRQRPVCNKITWYIMEAKDDAVRPNQAQNFYDGGFFPIDEAMDKVTYSQDKSLLAVAYQKYRTLK